MFPPRVSQFGELRPTKWVRFTSLRHPSKFQRVSRLAFVPAATSLTGGQPKFARRFSVSWAGTLYIQFRGLLPPDGILPGAKFTLHPSLAFSYIGRIIAWSASLCSIEQRVPHIFDRVAITLGIGPHPSLYLWSPYVIGQTIIFSCCGLFFFLLLLSFFFSSPNLSGRRLDVYHTLAHGVALVRI